MKTCKGGADGACVVTGDRPMPHPGPRHATCHRSWKQAQRQRTATRRRSTTYGVPDGFYERQLASQGGFCAICLRATGKTRRLSVDHDHKCAELHPDVGIQPCCIRGLLCRPCNDGLGWLRDSIDMASRVLLYLLDPPARR